MKRKTKYAISNMQKNCRNVKENDVKVGGAVFVKQKCNEKFLSRFNKTLYIVNYRKGTQIIAGNKQKHRATRNLSHFKMLENTEQRPGETESESDEDFI